MAKKIDIKSFEKNLEKLEEVVSKLESDQLSLDESLKEFESGVKLYQVCKSTLEEAQKKVTSLTEKLEEKELSFED